MSNQRTAGSATGAAIASWLAMMACCLPLPAVLAAGSFGALGAWLPTARPYLLALAFATLAYAFYRLYHRRFCESRRPAYLQLMAWLSLALVTLTALAPERLANLLAGTPARSAPSLRSGQPSPLVTIRSLDALKQAFNHSVHHKRLIALLSPT
jgi:predicted PurR-regulated permease PerM